MKRLIDKFRAVKKVDVVMPTTDGRIVTLPRYVEPKPDLAILLDRLGLTLPAQPPTEDFRRSCRRGENDCVVKTYKQNPSNRWGFARERGKSG